MVGMFEEVEHGIEANFLRTAWKNWRVRHCHLSYLPTTSNYAFFGRAEVEQFKGGKGEKKDGNGRKKDFNVKQITLV